MIIPIGSEKLRERFPHVTVALIAVNVLVFAFAWPAEQRAEKGLQQRLVELARLEHGIERHYLGRTLDGWAGEVPSRLRGRTELERTFWSAYAAGRIVPSDDPDWTEWHERTESFARAEKERPFRKWGLAPGSHPLSLVTHAFLHAGFLHLLFNMLFLWTVGVNVEDVWGKGVFLALYGIGGLAALLGHRLAAGTDDAPLVGASGAVAAIMGAFLVRHHSVRIRMAWLIPLLPSFSVAAWIFLPFWFAQQLLGLSEGKGSGVAFGAHVGGFLLGAAIALLFRWRGVEEAGLAESLQARHQERQRAQHLLRIEQLRRRGDAAGMLAEYEAALAADPGDAELALGRYRILRAVRPADAFDEGLALLERLRSTGQAARLPEAFALVDGNRGERPMPPEWIVATAAAHEARDPRGAADLFWRFLQEAPTDPAVPRVLERYELVLERLGHAELAAQVRARRTASSARAEPS